MDSTVGMRIVSFVTDAIEKAWLSERLMKAVERNEEPTVLALLDKGADANHMDIFGRRPLHLATKHGNSNLLTMLLDRGAQVNALDLFRMSPLHISIKWVRPAIMKLLLERGADANLLYRGKKNPLSKAIATKHTGLVEMLLEHGAEVNDEVVKGIHFSDPVPAAMAHALQLKNPNVRFVTVSLDQGLLAAIEARNENFSRILMDRGADINLRNEDGESLVHICSRRSLEEIGEMLVILGAEVNTRSIYNTTPLHHAIARKDKTYVQVLLECDADMFCRSEWGNEPWQTAIWKKKRETQLVLVNHMIKLKTLGLRVKPEFVYYAQEHFGMENFKVKERECQAEAQRMMTLKMGGMTLFEFVKLPLRCLKNRVKNKLPERKFKRVYPHFGNVIERRIQVVNNHNERIKKFKIRLSKEDEKMNFFIPPELRDYL